MVFRGSPMTLGKLPGMGHFCVSARPDAGEDKASNFGAQFCLIAK